MSEYYDNIVATIARIPSGKVATYAQVAELAGNARAARTVSYVLHSSSRKLKLPWQRVVNSKGTISLPRGGGYERQKRLLRTEGVEFLEGDRIDLARFGWRPRFKAKSLKKKTTRRIVRMPDERGPR